MRVVALAIVASVAAGTSGLAHASPFSPLFILGVVVAMAVSISWLQKPVWALYAAIFVVFLPQGLIPEYINDYLNRSLLIIALAVWVFDVIARRRRIVWTGTMLLMLGFLTWSIVTLSWAPNVDVGARRLVQYTLRFILFLLLVTNEINTHDTLKGLMRTLALNGWVLVLVGAGTVLLVGYEAGTRLRVLAMNQNVFGIWIMITMPAVLWHATQRSGGHKTLRRLLGVSYIILAIGLVTLSGSRGGAISLFIILLLYWAWKPTRLWGKLGLIILVVAAISAPLIFSITAERFIDQTGGILGGRIPIWKGTWQVIREHPLGGVGIGNAANEIYPRVARLRVINPGSGMISIHNPILGVWADTGIVGLLLYLGVTASAIWVFIREYFYFRKSRKNSLMLYFALVSSMFVGYLLSWMNSGAMEYHQVHFLVLALLLIPSQIDREGQFIGGETDGGGIGVRRSGVETLGTESVSA